MRKTLSILTAIAGALILTILAAAPAQADTNELLYVNNDNGYVWFAGDSGSVPNDEAFSACDTKDDGYAIIALLDVDNDGNSDVRVTTGVDSRSCPIVADNIKTEDKLMTFWGCQVKAGNYLNCTDRRKVYA